MITIIWRLPNKVNQFNWLIYSCVFCNNQVSEALAASLAGFQMPIELGPFFRSQFFWINCVRSPPGNINSSSWYFFLGLSKDAFGKGEVHLNRFYSKVGFRWFIGTLVTLGYNLLHLVIIGYIGLLNFKALQNVAISFKDGIAWGSHQHKSSNLHHQLKRQKAGW